MCAAVFNPCIFQSRATPLGRSRYQTSEFLNTSEFSTELPNPPQARNGESCGLSESLGIRSFRSSVFHNICELPTLSCVEMICRRALLPFGSQQKIARIQPSSADGSRRASKGGPQLGYFEIIRRSIGAGVRKFPAYNRMYFATR